MSTSPQVSPPQVLCNVCAPPLGGTLGVCQAAAKAPHEEPTDRAFFGARQQSLTKSGSVAKAAKFRKYCKSSYQLLLNAVVGMALLAAWSGACNGLLLLVFVLFAQSSGEQIN